MARQEEILWPGDLDNIYSEGYRIGARIQEFRSQEFRSQELQEFRRRDRRPTSTPRSGRLWPLVLTLSTPAKQHVLHRLRYGYFVIRRKDDLEFFSAVCCMHLESKDAQAFLMAHMKVFEPKSGNERNDSPKYCP